MRFGLADMIRMGIGQLPKGVRRGVGLADDAPDLVLSKAQATALPALVSEDGITAERLAALIAMKTAGVDTLTAAVVAAIKAMSPESRPISYLGSPIAKWKSSGTDFDFALSADGGPTVGTFGTVPADAIALEVWSDGAASDDYVFWSSRSGQLSNVGVLATNISNNLGATNPNRYVSSGQHQIIPLQAVGSIGAALRFAGGKASARCQGRFITQSSGLPYLLANSSGSSEEFVLSGAGASQQLPYNNTAKFPAGYTGCFFQVVGSGGIRARWDGSAPTALFGELLSNGYYWIDTSKHGISLSALRLYMPSGTRIIGNALVSA